MFVFAKKKLTHPIVLTIFYFMKHFKGTIPLNGFRQSTIAKKIRNINTTNNKIKTKKNKQKAKMMFRHFLFVVILQKL